MGHADLFVVVDAPLLLTVVPVEEGMFVTEWHDLIPLTSGSHRREVPGIEATGHFSDT